MRWRKGIIPDNLWLNLLRKSPRNSYLQVSRILMMRPIEQQAIETDEEYIRQKLSYWTAGYYFPDVFSRKIRFSPQASFLPVIDRIKLISELNQVKKLTKLPLKRPEASQENHTVQSLRRIVFDMVSPAANNSLIHYLEAEQIVGMIKPEDLLLANPYLKRIKGFLQLKKEKLKNQEPQVLVQAYEQLQLSVNSRLQEIQRKIKRRHKVELPLTPAE